MNNQDNEKEILSTDTDGKDSSLIEEVNEQKENNTEKETEKKTDDEEEHLDPLLTAPSRAKVTLLATALAISFCGISYELLAAAVSSYFLGNAILQYSLTIGVFLFAMGIGSWLSRKFLKNLVDNFILIEIIIGLFGGFATFILFAAYRFTPVFSPIMYGVLLVLGTLIGLEIPILIRILKNYKSLRFSISDILSFDYVGALFASIAFPLLVLPYLGMMHASFFYAILNMVIVFLNLSVFKNHLKKPKYYINLSLVVTVILIVGFLLSAKFVTFFEGKLYDDEVILTKQTKYQRIIMTRYGEDTRLFIDGNLQFSSWDEYRYHECLVHPAMSLAANREQVVILGGGDGLAAREVLKYPDVKQVTLVDIDPDIIELCRKDPVISKLNNHSLDDPRMNIKPMDAFKFMEDAKQLYGVIIVDLPDPNNESLSKLYTRGFYNILKHKLAKGGTISIQSTSPYFARETYWCIYHTIESIGLETKPYHVYVPSMGDWGFTLASNVNIDPTRIKIEVPTKFLNGNDMDPFFYFGRDSSEVPTELNTLNTHKLLQYYEKEWKKWE